MKTHNKSILATIVLTGAIALCSLNVSAATANLAAPQQKMQSDTTRMKKEKMKMMKMEQKKMAKMKADKMKADKKMEAEKMKMDKMKSDTSSKM